MKYLSPLAALALSLLTLCSCDKECKRLDSLYEDLPFEMPKVALPDIPKRSVTLTDFGGVGDGVALNTEAFAQAIDALVQKGGGRLVVPAGIWRTGPIALQSRIELYLEADAIVVFDPDRDLYPIIDTNFEGLDVRRCTSPIHAEGATDIAITGSGIFDGCGDYWRELKRAKVGDKLWKSTLARGGVVAEDGWAWYPDEGYMKARLSAGSLNLPDPSLDENEIKSFLRPVLLSLRECERVLLEGVTFQNSPCWNLHPLWCKDLIVKDVTVRNPHYSTNGDGIDIDGCEGVIVVGSSFDVGDDAICIKSGKDADGRRHARTCRNLIISDCTVYHGHGGFVVGSEMSGGVENIKVSDCRFIGTDALAVQEAGAFSVVLECIPAPVSALITSKLDIPTIGIGGGTECDGQILVYQDMLGTFTDYVPKFVKHFANIGEEMTKAFKAYDEEVKAKTFPDDEHSFQMKNEEALKRLY